MQLLRFGISLTLVLTAMAAETVTLKDGHVIVGTYLGGSPSEMKLEVNDQIRTVNVADIVRVEFNTSRESGISRERRDLETRGVGDRIELPAGTHLTIRMIDGVDSERNSVGQTFAASLDESVVVDGRTVIPRGSDVVVKLVDAKESGKLTGRTILTLDLVSLKANGRTVDVNTETVTEESSSRGARTAKVVGGTAALGTIIGAIAGGGKGAAIGLGTGAAVGAGAEILTKGQRVRIPSETRLTFVLENALKL